MRLSALLLFISFVSTGVFAQAVPENDKIKPFRADTLCLNKTERELARQLNAYRSSQNLPDIEISASLSLVARVHVYDLARNYKHGSQCNLHSWSSSKYWSSCCYTQDHRKAACMWDKPRELTSYKGDGYEIAFYSNYAYNTPAECAADILKGWKGSRGHHELIVNKGKWATADWKAIGVGFFDGFAVVWFGEQTDPAGKPKVCGE